MAEKGYKKLYGQYQMRQLIILLVILSGLKPVQATDRELVKLIYRQLFG
jgi:hypothetical protein